MADQYTIDWILLVATALGLFSLSKFILGFLNFVWLQFLRPPKDLVKTYGTWALVTGGANGIGQALAFQLASKGLNLVILDRDETQLEITRRKLHEEFRERVEVRCVLMDLNKLNKDEIVNGIREGIEGLDVGVLINCAGTAYSYPRFLHEVDLDVGECIINVNAGGLTWVTMAVIPSMMKKKRGAIVNISSASANASDAFPLVSIYGATKAYVKHFSLSTSIEYKRFGIDVQCQAPFTIATKLMRRKKGNLIIPTPETYSKASIRWIGYEDICVPYWPHYVITILGKNIVPRWITNWFMMRLNMYLREIYMKKDGDVVIDDDLDVKKKCT